MLEDIKKELSVKAKAEEERLQKQNADDAELLACYKQHLPTLEQFCRESGWACSETFFREKPIRGTAYSIRSLCVTIGPSGQSVLELALSIGVVTNFLGFGGQRAVMCHADGGSWNPSHDAQHFWNGVSHEELVKALRASYRRFGSTA